MLEEAVDAGEVTTLQHDGERGWISNLIETKNALGDMRRIPSSNGGAVAVVIAVIRIVGAAVVCTDGLCC